MQVNLWCIGRWRGALNPRVAGQGLVHRRVPAPGRWLALFLPLCLVLPTTRAAPAASPDRPGVHAPMTVAEQGLLDAINHYRGTQGRAPWQPEPGLVRLARSHSQGMAARGRLGHDGFQRRAAGTGSHLCVENLLRGSVPPALAVQLWTRSAAHRDNLLEPATRYAGIGQAGAFVTMLACATPPGPLASPENGASGAGRHQPALGSDPVFHHHPVRSPPAPPA